MGFQLMVGFVSGVVFIVSFEVIVERHVNRGFRNGYIACLKKYGIVDNASGRQSFVQRYESLRHSCK
jgi:hypothetical protein